MRAEEVVSGLTGIICAVDAEIKPFLAELKDETAVTHARLDFYLGVINRSSVVLVCSGVCKVNAAVATQVMIDRFKPDRVAFSGTAGAVDGRLHIGDTVIVTESVYHDVAGGVLYPEVFKSDAPLVEVCRAALEKNPHKQAVYYGRAVTGEAFIIKDGRRQIVERFNPLCVDMETAAAAHACYMNGVPFLAVRSVTDTENDAGYGSFFMNVKTAARNSFEVVKTIL